MGVLSGGTPGGRRPRAGRFALPALVAAAIVLAAAAGAPAASKAPLARPLAATSKRLTISATAPRTCTDRLAAPGTLGANVTRWTAPADGYVQARLGGDERNDWDLALFDAASHRRLDASLAWGSNELVQAYVRRGEALDFQACRLSGPSAIEPLSIEPVATPLAKPGAKLPKESLVSIPISSGADFRTIESLGLNVDEVPNGHRAVAILNGPADAAKLAKAGYSYKTRIADLAAAERRYRAKERSFGRAKAAASPLPSGRTQYRHYPDIQADLKKIAARHKGLVRKVTLPKKTFQGRDITGIEVTDHVGRKDDGKPIFWLMGAHHAREWPSAEIPVEYALYLTNRFGHDARVTRLLKRVRVVVTPVINIDGYLASRNAPDPADNSGDPGGAPSLGESVAPPGGSLAYRRKNCDGESSDPSTPCNLQHGVDNNRNYGQFWGGPGAGTNPGDQDYRGSDMWSEPENQAVWHFSQRHDVTTLVTMHNFASLVLRPPGRHDQGLAPDETALRRLGDRMARDTGYTSEYGFQLYDTSGTTEDWNYAAAGTFGYTIEMGPDDQHGGNFHIEYQRGVVDQWTGAETLDGKGKGLRDALLAAGEAAANRHQFSTLRGTALPGATLRIHKKFTTYSDNICGAETTGYDCSSSTPRLGVHKRPDFLDYTTQVPGSGRFSWIVTPSTRPFELKKGRSEKWTMTCESPVGHRVLGRRTVTIDRGQTLVLGMRCGVKRLRVTGNRCVAHHEFREWARRPRKGSFGRIDVFVNGRRVQKLTGKRARRGKIHVKHMRPRHGRYKLTVIAYYSDGSVKRASHTYRNCAPGQHAGRVGVGR